MSPMTLASFAVSLTGTPMPASTPDSVTILTPWSAWRGTATRDAPGPAVEIIASPEVLRRSAAAAGGGASGSVEWTASSTAEATLVTGRPLSEATAEGEFSTANDAAMMTLYNTMASVIWRCMARRYR